LIIRYLFFYSFIHKHSNEGSVILDLTGGSGACLVASINNARSCIYSDVDERQAKYAADLIPTGKYLNILIILKLLAILHYPKINTVVISDSTPNAPKESPKPIPKKSVSKKNIIKPYHTISLDNIEFAIKVRKSGEEQPTIPGKMPQPPSK
jgi:hypothetical protein